MMKLNLLATLCVLALNFADAGKILIYPYGHCLNSHLLNAEKLAGILKRSGHEVHMVVSTAYNGYVHKTEEEDSTTTGNITLIQFQSPTNYKPICEYDTMDFMLHSPIKDRFDAMMRTSNMYCDALLEDRALVHSLKTGRYDLMIVESLDPCSKILADYLDIPFMPLMTAGLGHWDGNPRPASYLPAAISPYTSDMTFFQRLGNVIMKNMYDIIPVIMGFETHFQQLKEKYGMNLSLDLSDTFDRAAIKLVNSDFAIDYPAPIEPDTVMIGGFAVDDPPKPLSDELEEFMQSSGDAGVIVMSFGTLTKRFDPAWSKMFVEALNKVPQKVVWRYYPSEESIVDTVFNNTKEGKFKLMRWLPQASLLRHPKTKLFISHCGLNGMFETTHFGVPVLAIPLSGDQMQNAAKLTGHLQMGVHLDIFTATSDDLYSALTNVLGDPRYATNARSVSARVRDQPMDATAKITYWVDYVIRHQGAPHLKSRAHKLTWVQYHCLDVFCFMGALIIAIMSTLVFISCKLFSKLYSLIADEVCVTRYVKKLKSS